MSAVQVYLLLHSLGYFNYLQDVPHDFSECLDQRRHDFAALLLVEGDDLLAELRDIWLRGGQYPLLVR